MAKTPILLLSDSASGTTGLGRIVRELANHIHEDMSDVFRVGVLGVGGNYSSRLPYPNWAIRDLQNMIPMDLPQIWEDFARGEKGVMTCIWNLSWLGWLAQPERLPPNFPIREFLGSGIKKPDSMSDEAWGKLNPQMQKVLGKKENGPFKKWLYCPVDGDLPDGTLGVEAAPVLAGFDRILAYTKYGSGVIERTFSKWNSKLVSIPNLPHGTDRKVFYPRDRQEARATFVKRLSQGKSEMPIYDDIVLLGVIATNSFRKDWGLAFQVCNELLSRGKNVFLWCHTNLLGLDQNPQAYWNLLALSHQFNMGSRVVLTTHAMTDEDVAWGISALDCLIGNGSGEGWGMTSTDALACGVPVIHGDYAGGTDFIPKEFLVPMESYRLESKWMIRRPSFNPSAFADRVEFALTFKGKRLAVLPDYIDWDVCWPAWRKWLLDGLEA
jgi:glycosyltransferase involved in cell wall biosynthesis